EALRLEHAVERLASRALDLPAFGELALIDQAFVEQRIDQAESHDAYQRPPPPSQPVRIGGAFSGICGRAVSRGLSGKNQLSCSSWNSRSCRRQKGSPGVSSRRCGG